MFRVIQFSRYKPQSCVGSKNRGGDEGDRTPYPLLARQVLSQMSYTPTFFSRFQPFWIGSFEVWAEPQKLNSDKTCQSGFFCKRTFPSFAVLLRKEVIQPHLPIRLPCYDFTPIINPTFGSVPLVRLLTSGVIDSHGVTGGVYKARERIHRGMLIRDY